MSSILIEAIKSDSLTIVQACIDPKNNLKIDINEPNEYGSTPLIWASIKNNLEIVKLLLKNGADVDKPDKHGMTPLMDASIKGFTENIKLLLEAGADSTIVNNDGKTALLIASKYDHSDVIELLKKHENTNSKISDNDYTTLIDKKFAKIAQLIIEVKLLHKGMSPTSDLDKNFKEKISKILESI